MFLVCSFFCVVFLCFFIILFYFYLLCLRSSFPDFKVKLSLPFGLCPPMVGPVVFVSFIQVEIYAEVLLLLLLCFLGRARQSHVVILSADDQVCMFVLMRHVCMLF